MRGHISPETRDARTHDDYAAAASRGRASGASIVVELTIRASDLDAFRRDALHRASITGTVHVPALAPGVLAVTDGSFECFSADPERPDAKNMWYRLALASPDGGEFFFAGYKVITAGAVVNLWPQTTTLYATVRAGAL